jgi:hypothetical protein
LGLSGEWNEETITFNSSPATALIEAEGIAIGAAMKKHFLSIDLTQLLREWVTGDRPNYGVMLRSAGGANVSFDSKESVAGGHEPVIEIILVESGPQGPAGQQGEKGERGEQGVRGPVGESGQTGATGEMGPQGERGEKGEKGDVGPTGPPVTTTLLRASTSTPLVVAERATSRISYPLVESMTGGISTDTSGITVSTTGYYVVSASVTLTNITGVEGGISLKFRLLKNDVVSDLLDARSVANPVSLRGTTLLYLQAGDRLAFEFENSNYRPATVSSDSRHNVVSVLRVGL